MEKVAFEAPEITEKLKLKANYEHATFLTILAL